MPNLTRERCGNETAGEENNAHRHDCNPTYLAGQDRAQWSNDHGCSELDAADEGIIERSSACIVLSVLTLLDISTDAWQETYQGSSRSQDIG